MNKKVVVPVVTFLVVAFVATVVFAGSWHGQVQRPGVGCGLHCLPNLTQEQAGKIQEMRERHFKEVAPLKQQIMAKRLELRAQWLSKNPDEKKINALQKEIMDLRTKIQEKTTNMRLEARKILSPEQQAQLGACGLGMGFKKGKMGWRGWL